MLSKESGIEVIGGDERITAGNTIRHRESMSGRREGRGNSRGKDTGQRRAAARGSYVGDVREVGDLAYGGRRKRGGEEGIWWWEAGR